MATMFDVANTQVSIRKVLEDYVGSPSDQKRGNLHCPFHADNRPSFHVYDATNSYYCFSCKKSGTPVNLVAELKQLTPEAAAKELCDKYSLSYEDKTPVNPNLKLYTEVLDFVQKLFVYYTLVGQSDPMDYITNRGITKPIYSSVGLGYCPPVFINGNQKVMSLKEILMNKFPSSNPVVMDSYGLYDGAGQCIFAGRYTFPIRNKQGQVVGFAGRSVNPTDPAKYLNTPENEFFKKRWLMFNMDNALKYSTVIVVEGYMDAMSLIEQGIPNVVALMGTALTEEHLVLLRSKNIILSLDNDVSGMNAMVRIIEDNPKVRFFIPNYYYPSVKSNGKHVLTQYKDFNDAHIAKFDFKSYLNLKNTIYGVEFVVRHLAHTIDLSSLSSREDLYNRVNALSKNYSPVVRDYLSIVLSRLLKGKRGNK